MKPTVGRIVHYHSVTPAIIPVRTADGKNLAVEYSGPFAALVAFVHEDGSVVLDVSSPPHVGGQLRDHITAMQAPGDRPTAGHWNWPPREA